MKKSTLIFSVLSLTLFNACGSLTGAIVNNIDPSMAKIKNVNVLPVTNAIGFEWPSIKDTKVHGINIYRGNPKKGKQSLSLVDSVNSRYATHYVDTNVEADTSYIYTFTTYGLGKESNYGTVLRVKTKSAKKGVTFIKAFKVAPRTVKVLWSPHASESIEKYLIQRAVNKGDWRTIAEKEGQLNAEFIDTFVEEGYNYKYRVIAQSYDDILTQASDITAVSL